MAQTAKNSPSGRTPVPPRGKKKGGSSSPRPAPASAAKRPPTGRQAAQQRHRRRQQTWIAGVATAVVVVVVVVLVAVGLSSGGAKAAPRTAVPPATSHALQSVPVADLVAASAKVSDLSPATILNAKALTSANKPQFLFIGAEFCPICATERWPMVVALSQFGTFTNLQQTRSAVRDGNIATLSFYGSTYSSPYLTFTPVETTTNVPKGNYYQTLQTPTAQEQALWSSTLGGNLSFPFIDIGGKYMLNTSQFPDTTLEGHSFNDIANSVGDNTNTIGADIDSSAASLVKYICGITGDKPAAACSAVANVNAATTTGSASGASSSAG